MDDSDRLQHRLARLDRAIQDQRSFLHRIPDPDTRERGERHLYELIEMREALAAKLETV